MKDVADIARDLSESAEPLQGRSGRFFVSEKAAQGWLQDRLVSDRYPDTLAEVDIAIQCGTMRVKRIVDLQINKGLLVELKLRDDIRPKDRQQLIDYLQIFKCDHGLLIVFPKTDNGHFRVERAIKEVDDRGHIGFRLKQFTH